MTSGSLIHFGVDQCFRMRVLQGAGFSVADCESLEALSAELLERPDALVVEEEPNEQVDKAISLSRSFPAVPLILFRPLMETAPCSADLTIRSFTPPELWLHEIKDLIVRNHVLVAQSHRT